jgi:hypothetical protein
MCWRTLATSSLSFSPRMTSLHGGHVTSLAITTSSRRCRREGSTDAVGTWANEPRRRRKCRHACRRPLATDCRLSRWLLHNSKALGERHTNAARRRAKWDGRPPFAGFERLSPTGPVWRGFMQQPPRKPTEHALVGRQGRELGADVGLARRHRGTQRQQTPVRIILARRR